MSSPLPCHISPNAPYIILTVKRVPNSSIFSFELLERDLSIPLCESIGYFIL